MKKKIILFIAAILFCLVFTQVKAACGITALGNPQGIAKQLPQKDFFVAPGLVHVQCNANSYSHFFISKENGLATSGQFFYAMVIIPGNFHTHTGYLLQLFPSHYFW